MRRRPWVAAATAWLTILTSAVINYATQFAPPWTRNPWIIWPALGVLAALFGLLPPLTTHRHDHLPPARHPGSLRPPTLDVPVRGRDAELSRLKGLLKRSRGRFAVICGPGGSGKTTVAAALAARTRATVWWIHWHDRESFVAQFAGALGLPRDRPDLLWQVLAERRKWLLVIDNLDRPQELSLSGEPLREYRGWIRGGGRGLLLVTSRDADPRTWGPAAELIPVDTLSTKDAAVVLLDAAPEAGAVARAAALANRLGRFPLALRAAGLAMAQPTARYRTFDAYRAALDEELGDILATPHEGPLTTDQKRALLRYTWDLSLDQLADEGFPQARPLLRMLSLAADAPLPRDLVTPELFKGKASRAAVDGALAGLHHYGLVGIRHGAIDCVILHVLVREITAMLADEAGSGSWQNNLDRILLDDAQRTAATGRAGWARLHLLIPHILPVTAHRNGQPKAGLSACRKLMTVAQSIDNVGHGYERSLLWSHIHEVLHAIAGPDHHDTIGARGKLASALRDVGEYERAAELYKRNVLDYARVLGPYDANTLASRSNFAGTLHNLGQLRLSAELLEQVLVDCERELGPDHPHTLTTQTVLAHVLSDLDQSGQQEHHAAGDAVASEAIHVLGGLQVVRSLGENVLRRSRRLLGPDDSHTLLLRTTVADIVNAMDQIRRVLDDPSLPDRERIVDSGHLIAMRGHTTISSTSARLKGRK